MNLKYTALLRGFGAMLLLLPLLASTCKRDDAVKKITLTSSAFQHGGKIPRIHTCEGPNESPALQWDNLPENTKSLALIVDDPDAPNGTFVHWVAWNIDPSLKSLPQNTPPQASATVLSQGINSYNNPGYAGPCPPSGEHRYFFKLYAVDTKLELSAPTKKDDLLKALAGHILSEGELMGKYQKGANQ
jgi:Raf kinase inhibitor-like YbhB/YbcL family protein